MYNLKVGILGGGQLGRMLIAPAIDLAIELHFLDNDVDAPCKAVSPNFHRGDITNYDDVLNFGRQMDLLSIEIEKVSADALETLEKEGKKVFPQPHIIRLIQDKRLQKQFYKDHFIPTSDFVLLENKADLLRHQDKFPAVQKLAKDGYDGKGVQIIHDLTTAKEKGFDAPSLLEKKVTIAKEVSVIVARNQKGEISTFDPVEMVVNPNYHLLDYLLAPAQLSAETAQKSTQLAKAVIEQLGMVGILAVELFVTPTGEVLVNEVAPRPHNSGHHSIEACITSQYAQHLRAILNLPLGDTSLRTSAAILNLIGAENHTGTPVYEGIEKLMTLKGVYPHIYGKKITKAGRKMGHITILGESLEQVNSLQETIEKVKKNSQVIAAK